MSRSGADLALLLLGGFRALADEAHRELAERGYEDVRSVHDFAIRAIDAGADTAAELGRRLTVSKQAAAKTIAVLEGDGYVRRVPDPGDARRKRLEVTERGHALLRDGEAIFDGLRRRWEEEIGVAELARLEGHLARLAGPPIRLDAPGWVAEGVAGQLAASPRASTVTSRRS